MNILQVLSSKVLGGIEQVNLDYCTLLQDRGHSITLCMHPAAETLSKARQTGATVLADGAVSGGFALGNPLSWPKYRRYIGRNKVDAIIMHNGKSRPLFQAAARGRCPVIGVCHNENFKQRLRMDAAICVNTAMLERFRAASQSAGNGQRPSFYVPNPLSPASQAVAPGTRKERSDPVVIGSLCRMTRKKGNHILLAAAARLRDQGVPFRAVLGGEGPELPALRAMAAELDLEDKVSFPGWITDQEAFFTSIDIFCLPSIREPFGLVVTEAMVRGCPVVSSDADGPRDIIDDGQTGLIVKKDEPELLATALRRLVEDGDLAARLATAGQISVRERFGPKRVGEMLETALTEISEDHARKN